MAGAATLNSLNHPSIPAGVRRVRTRNCSDSITKECTVCAWHEHHCSGRGLDRAIANRNGHLAFQHIEGFLFPMMDMRRWSITFSGDRLDQCELPLRFFGCGQEGHQRTVIPDRPIQGLPSSSKCDGFFDFRVYRDLCCHDRLLFDLRFLALAGPMMPGHKFSRS